MELPVAILGVVGTLVAAIAAVGAWQAAHQSSRTAAAMTEIERRRWHADLTPRFGVSCTATSDNRAQLQVALMGPPGLDRLDELTITIRDDIHTRAPRVAGGPTAEQIAEQIWGPYRFVPGVDGADRSGRRVAPVALRLGDWLPFALERTLPPSWSSDTIAAWQQDRAGQPVRLTFTCVREGHEPWTVPVEVAVRDYDPERRSR